MSNRRRLPGTDWEPLSRQIRTITTGRENQLRAEINSVAPGFLDQAAAATTDAIGHYLQFGRDLKHHAPTRAGEVDARKLPDQILDQITGLYLRVITETATGERKRCPHIRLEAPRPAVACAHADWIYCRPCFARNTTRPLLTEREEHTCVLCGTYRPRQTMHALYPQVGPVDSGRAAAAEMGLDGAESYLEWSAADDADPSDPAVWSAVMPALNVTIYEATIAEDRQLMDELEWKRAYLNQWTAGTARPWAVIDAGTWARLVDPRARIRDVDRRCFGLAVAPDRRAAAVAAAGPADGGRLLVEVECYLPGTDWAPGRLAALYATFRPAAVVVDPGSPAGALIPDIEQARVAVTGPFTARDAAAAGGVFRDYVAAGRLVHRGQPELDAAVEAATLRPLAGSAGWDTRDGG